MDQRQRYLQMPMPPGWEVKYDFSSQKYFFIDHNTKNTAWEDPRPAYYMRLERQRQQQQQQAAANVAAARQLAPSPQPGSATPNRFTQAVSSLNSGPSRSPATTPSRPRRPETIQLQQVRQQERQAEGASDSEEEIPALGGDEYEIAVLQSKFPNVSKEDCQTALSAAKRERPNRAGGQVTRAAQFLRNQGASGSTPKPGSGASQETDKMLGAKCRTLCSEFPGLASEQVMTVLREHDGHMYKTKERLKVLYQERQESRQRALVQKYPNVDKALIVDMLREAASRIDGDSYVESRLEFLQSSAGPAPGPAAAAAAANGDASSSAASPASLRHRATLQQAAGGQRHPSPQPRSLVEGQDSLERQRAHHQLVATLSSEFPMVERALVRKTLAAVAWNLEKGRERLRGLRNSQLIDRSASPASINTPIASPARSQASRGPSPRPGSSSTQTTRVLSPQAVQPVVRPTPKKQSASSTPQRQQKAKPAAKKTRPASKDGARVGQRSAGKTGRAPVAFRHKTLARGPDPSLPQGHDKELAHGPDPALVHGPDSSLVVGACGGVGRDLSLQRGADPSLLVRRPNAHL